MSSSGAAVRIDNAAALLYLPVGAKLRRLAGGLAKSVPPAGLSIQEEDFSGINFFYLFIFLPSNRG